MGFSKFYVQLLSIANDFGMSSVKLLQLNLDDRLAVIAAAALPIPDVDGYEFRSDSIFHFPLLYLIQKVAQQCNEKRYKKVMS